MTPSTDWEVIRHHISICGRVRDENENPLPGIQLTATPSGRQPETEAGSRRPAKARAEVKTESVGRSWQTESRPDGMFFFLDCPDGQYVVTAMDARSGARAEKLVPVADAATKKRMKDRGKEEGYQIELVLKK